MARTTHFTAISFLLGIALGVWLLNTHEFSPGLDTMDKAFLGYVFGVFFYWAMGPVAWVVERLISFTCPRAAE
jgi:hypothetical protein